MKQEYLEFAKDIAKEAGGKVTDLFGHEQRYDRNINGAIISNTVVHDHIIDTINKYDIKER